jgi:thiosulfate/3-mercaptopyruvate sulfurtransferase
MRRASLLFVLALFPAALPAQDQCGMREPAPGLLVSADWLKRHREDSGLVVLDVERSRAPYDSAHLVGAHFIAMADYTMRRGDLLTELPPAAQLDSLLESLGIGDRARIVLYGETLPVTRLFFTLDYLGLGERVSLLDGGLSAWREARGEVTALPTPPPPRGQLSVRPQPATVATTDWIRDRLGDSGVTLLDVRSPEEFAGTKLEDGVARAGHIPSARNLDWTATLEGGRFRGKDALRQLLTNAGVVPGKEIVAYCRVGTRATALYFVARLLGYPVRLYDGSMNEWAGRRELPVVGPKP